VRDDLVEQFIDHPEYRHRRVGSVALLQAPLRIVVQAPVTLSADSLNSMV